jgi:hypothetical protein
MAYFSTMFVVPDTSLVFSMDFNLIHPNPFRVKLVQIETVSVPLAVTSQVNVWVPS